MTAVKAYYNGTTFVPLQNYSFKSGKEVLIVVDDDETEKLTPAERFLSLSWDGDENAEQILSGIYSERKNSSRFGDESELFD